MTTGGYRFGAGAVTARLARCALVFALIALAAAAPAQAKTFTVNKTDDHAPDGCTAQDCTLREAVLAANARPGADVIELRGGRVYRLEIEGRDEDESLTGDLDLRDVTEIRAAGGERLAIVDAAAIDRAFDAFARTTLRRVEVRRGDPDDGGTGIRATDAPLVLRDVRVRGGSSSGVAILQSGAGGITGADVVVGPNGYGGVTESDGGSLVLRRATVRDNDSYGLAELGAGDLVATDSVIRQNGGTAAYEGGEGDLEFTRSSARLNGAGVAEDGEGRLLAVRSHVVLNDGWGLEEDGPGALNANRAVVRGNGGYAALELGPGRLSLDGARLTGNDENGAFEQGAGDLSAASAVIVDNAGYGLQESDEGSLLARGATVAGNGLGAGEEGPGRLDVRGATLSSNATFGAYEASEGDLVAHGARVRRNMMGLLEEDRGSLLADRARLEHNPGACAQEQGPGGLSFRRSSATDCQLMAVQETDGGGVQAQGARIERTWMGLVSLDGGDVNASGARIREALVMGLAVEGAKALDASGARIVDGGYGIAAGGVGSFTADRAAVARNGFGGISLNGTGSALIRRSTIANNGSAAGAIGGVVAMALEYEERSSAYRLDPSEPEAADGPLVIRESTISGNRNSLGGAGVLLDGVAGRIVNSTLVDNVAGEGPGGGVLATGEQRTRLNAVTIARNFAPQGGGIAVHAGATALVGNALLAYNGGTESGPDCYVAQDGQLTSGGNNLLTDAADCPHFNAPGDMVRSQAGIGPLRDNGGPTKTIALRPGSPALNEAGRDAPKRDQRGRKRGPRPDIGAYERLSKRKPRRASR